MKCKIDPSKVPITLTISQASGKELESLGRAKDNMVCLNIKEGTRENIEYPVSSFKEKHKYLDGKCATMLYTAYAKASNWFLSATDEELEKYGEDRDTAYARCIDIERRIKELGCDFKL